MKKTILMLMTASVIGISCTKEPSLTPEQQVLQSKLVGQVNDDSEKGILLVKLTTKAQDDIMKGNLTAESVVGTLEGASIEPLFPVSDNAAASRHGLDRWYSVRFGKAVSQDAAAERLAANGCVQSIQYNSFIRSTHTSDVSIEYNPSQMTKAAAGTSALPFNDPQLNVQWNLINTGDKSISASAVEGADVGVKDAWRLTAGDPRIIVAVLDQGISTLHPDLVKNLWTNPSELNGQSGADDDGNGYKDDIYGYNFAENKGKPSAKYGADHGTHIAGTIAATNNNGIGVSSIAGGSGVGDGVRVMSCQIFDERGFKTSLAQVANAIKYAADNGASIIQCSYGESSKDIMSDSEYASGYTAEHDALMYFLDPVNANCDALETNIAVFAAGNYNKPASLYPGAMKECISVTAICPDFLPGGYSNYGAGCDIAAPGGDIVEGNPNAPAMILSTGYGSNGELTYVYKYGTSMACPHVSGVVALGMSYALKIGRKFSREEFISRLLTSANDIDALLTGPVSKLYVENNKYVEIDVFPKKGKMGAGAVDAWKFLMALEGTPSYMTCPGETLSIYIAECLGESHEKYTLDISKETKDALGIEGSPTVKNGILEIRCTKTGAGKICFRSSVGAEGQIQGLEFSKEISVVSRPSVAKNGGWL